MRAVVAICLVLNFSHSAYAQRTPEQSAFRRTTPVVDSAVPQASPRLFQASDDGRKAAIVGGAILGTLVGGAIGVIAAKQRMDRDCGDDGCLPPPYVAVYVLGGVAGGAVVGGVLGDVLSRKRKPAAASSR